MHQPNSITSTSSNFLQFKLQQSSTSSASTHLPISNRSINQHHHLKCPAVVQIVPSGHPATAMASTLNQQQQHISNAGQLHIVAYHSNGSNPAFLGINECVHVPQISHLSPPTNVFLQPPNSSATFINEIQQIGLGNQTTFLPSVPHHHHHQQQHQQPFFSSGHPLIIPPPHHHQQIITTPNRRYRPPSVITSDNIGGLVEGGRDCWTTAVTGWEQAAIIKNKIGLLVNNRFRILQSIASGSYGEIFAAEDLHSHGIKKQRVAVKFDGACRDNHLRYEYLVYKSVLYEDGNGKVEGFPQVYCYDHEFGHNIMVMELLGAPVASLFAFCNRRFARQTIVSLGEQMIHRIRHLHQRGFIHRDIKPENFLMGLPPGKESTLYLIDFGLARRYRFREGENRTLTHIPFRRGRSFIGTAKYASLNSHKNIELSRRDDLESLAYVLIELINGHLPWKNISKRNATTRHQASLRIRQLKEQTSWEEFCPCMAKFIRYCREIHFGDEPNYDKLLDMLQSVLIPEVSIYPSPSLPVYSNNNEDNNPTGNASTSSKADKLTSNIFCCQGLKTAEKMTQVNFGQLDDNDDQNLNKQINQLEQFEDVEERRRSDIDEKLSVATTSDEAMSAMAQSIQNFVITTTTTTNNIDNTNINNSDCDELGGAATTTTSCSENELDPTSTNILHNGITIRSGTGTADDEDSQPTPQQEQQQVCRKCRRFRDQTHQQQKRIKDQQINYNHLKQKKPQQRVDTALQTDLGDDILIGKQFKRSNTLPPPEQRKMCWQNARESNPERRFQYENKFSWTIPINAEHQFLFTQQPTTHHHPALQIIPPTAATLLPISPLKAPSITGGSRATVPFIIQPYNNNNHHHQNSLSPSNALINQSNVVLNSFVHPKIPLAQQIITNNNNQKHFSNEMHDRLQKQGTSLQVAFVLPPPAVVAISKK